jgi:hypothetical protein
MVAVLFSNTLINFALFINYQLNQLEITRKFCENKAKPKMQCNGKCYLAKQLAKQENQKQTPSDKKDFKVKIIELTAQLIEQIAFDHQIQKSTSSSCYAYSEARSAAHLMEIFHPPTV